MWGEWVVKMFYGANLKRQKAKKLKEKDVNCGPPPFQMHGADGKAATS
jgi:hypothetical protein